MAAAVTCVTCTQARLPDCSLPPAKVQCPPAANPGQIWQRPHPSKSRLLVNDSSTSTAVYGMQPSGRQDVIAARSIASIHVALPIFLVLLDAASGSSSSYMALDEASLQQTQPCKGGHHAGLMLLSASDHTAVAMNCTAKAQCWRCSRQLTGRTGHCKITVIQRLKAGHA